MGSRLEYPKFQAFDKNGNPLSGGWLFSYYPGTSTPKPLYTDALLATPWNNPVVLNSRGEALIYMDGGYKLVLSHIGTIDGETGVYTPGRIIWTVDNVFASGGGGGGGSGGCSGISLSDWGCDLADAVTDLGSDAASLCVDCDCAVDADLVVPANINLRYGNGSIITVASGKTLTINNMTDPGCFQIFAGAGTVLFSGSSTVSRPEWFPNADPHYAAYALKNTGGVVKIEAVEYTMRAHTITESGTYPDGLTGYDFSSTAGVHLYDHTTIEGSHHQNSILKLADSQDCDAVRSWNYVDLHEENRWLVSTGMGSGQGVRNLTIDGNKSNNTLSNPDLDGAGLRLYSKSIVLGGQVIAHDCAGHGIYTEGGADRGNTGYADTIQGDGGVITSCYNGGDGLRYLGPHDYFLTGANLYKNSGYGFYADMTEDESAGKIEIAWMHTFGNTNGIYIDANFQASIVTFEDRVDFPGSGGWNEIKIASMKVSGGNSSYFDTAHTVLLNINQEQFQCGYLRVVHLYRSTAIPDYSVKITADEVKIDQLNVWLGKVASDSGPPVVPHPVNMVIAAVGITDNGVDGPAVRTHIGNLQIEGTTTWGSDCVGLDVDGSYTRIGGGFIQRFMDATPSAGTSGVAIRIGNAAAVNGCDIRCDTRNNLNALYYVAQGNGNKFTGHLYQSSGQTGVHASSVIPSDNDDFNVHVYNTDATEIAVAPTQGHDGGDHIHVQNFSSRLYAVVDDVPIGVVGSEGTKKYTDAGWEMLRVPHKMPYEWVPLARATQVTLWSPAKQDFSAIPIVYDTDATYIYIALRIIAVSATGAAVTKLIVWARN